MHGVMVRLVHLLADLFSVLAVQQIHVHLGLKYKRQNIIITW